MYPLASHWLPAPSLYSPHATLSYAKALKMARCESVETTIRKRPLFSAGAVARQSKERMTSGVMFETMAGAENPRPGGQLRTWHRCIVEDRGESRATEGSTEHPPLLFGVETALWSTGEKQAKKWYPVVLETTERFMVRWHEDEAHLRRQGRASVFGGAQGNGGSGEAGGVEGNPTMGMRGERAIGRVEGDPGWTKVGRRRQTG